MPDLVVINRNGSEAKVTAEVGKSLMENLRDNGFHEVQAICGGCCSCATCHVHVGEQWLDRLGPMSALEEELLDCSDHLAPTSRLSCQVVVEEAHDGMTLTIAPEE